MNKKLLSLSLAALATAAQLSAAAPKIAPGPYAGAALGVSVLGGKNNYNHVQDGDLQDDVDFSLSKTSPSFSIFGGYGMNFNNFWTAAEAFYQFDSFKDKKIPKMALDDKFISSKSSGAYGAAIHLGFLPNENCLAYAILGIEARKFNVAFYDIGNIKMNAKINKSYTSNAFAPGVGVRFALTNNLSVRTEYKYAIHRNKKLTDTAKVPDPNPEIDTITLKHQPKVHNFNVGVVYTF